MTNQSKPNDQNTADRQPFISRSGSSPEWSPVPFWVTACVRLMPPLGRTGKPTDGDKIIVAAQLLLADRIRGHGDTAVELDRDRLALLLGYSKTDRSSWILDYLTRIGFLEIQTHYQPGKRGRGKDTFVVYERPPATYVGPRDYAELAHAVTQEWSAGTDLFVSSESPGQASTPAREGVYRSVYSRPEGERPQNRRSASTPAREGRDQSPEGERPQNRRSASTPAREGFPREIERENLSGSLSIDRGSSASGTDEPDDSPKTGDDAVDEVRRLVRRLPWVAKTGRMLTRSQADRIATNIRRAMARHGLSLADVEQHALQALADATTNAAAYVASAFTDAHLTEPAPVDDPLPLPTPITDEQQGTPSAPSTPRLPACDDCGARDGDAIAQRVLISRHGSDPCPCRSA